MFSNIIFDWTGVINDNVVTTYQVISDMFATWGVPKITFEEFQKEWTQPYMNFYRKFLPNLTLEEEHRLFSGTIVKYEKNLVYKNIDQLIDKFFQNKIKLFVVSGDLPSSIESQLKIFNLNNKFTEIISDSHDKTLDTKKLVNKHHLPLNSTIIIGDTNHEIEVGQSIGIKTCAVTWGFCLEEVLKTFRPDYIVHDLTELEKIIFNYFPTK
jgi:phosphoglycolate phosphatase